MIGTVKCVYGPFPLFTNVCVDIPEMEKPQVFGLEVGDTLTVAVLEIEGITVEHVGGPVEPEVKRSALEGSWEAVEEGLSELSKLLGEGDLEKKDD